MTWNSFNCEIIKSYLFWYDYFMVNWGNKCSTDVTVKNWFILKSQQDWEQYGTGKAASISRLWLSYFCCNSKNNSLLANWIFELEWKLHDFFPWKHKSILQVRLPDGRMQIVSYVGKKSWKFFQKYPIFHTHKIVTIFHSRQWRFSAGNYLRISGKSGTGESRRRGAESGNTEIGHLPLWTIKTLAFKRVKCQRKSARLTLLLQTEIGHYDS